MGKKTKLRRIDMASSSQDIGTLLRVTPQSRPTKMAPVREDSDSALEESATDDVSHLNMQGTPRANLDPQHPPQGRLARTTPSLEQTPASKADIQNLLREMKTLFAADIALVRKDLGVITARLQLLEDPGDNVQCRQDAQQSELDALKLTNLLMEGRIAALEDSKRQRNLKIQCP
ncbi:Hypothetical predicted protein [Pelobates cultripes]|uniref:Uncharacterized protein n=1 Tax=Pelobates cultripes TaxID=61616 RepID=A0AAD1WK84_PELCU|nr:Hypothetical predicted protein [Pelobates cultripes]